MLSPRTYYVGKVSARVKKAKARLRSEKEVYDGLRFIDFSGEQFHFPKGSRDIKTVLENVDKQPLNAFEVFTNFNSEVVIREVKQLPFYHIV